MIKIYATVVVGALAWCAAAQSQELDVYNINHWAAMQNAFIKNQQKEQIKANATDPSDAIDDALANFSIHHIQIQKSR
tara:strand:+ start:195 stop:428 length:234 start_codon:yes stop_codon:yes gene_type:complete